MKRILILSAMVWGATGAAAQQPSDAAGQKQPPTRSVAAPPPSRPVAVPDLPALVDAWLRGPATGKDAAEKLDYLHRWLGSDLLRQQLAAVSDDPSEPALVRARALIALGEEHPTAVTAFGLALDDTDPTVRAAAAIALKPVLLDRKLESSVVAELRRALRDPSPVVASRALEAIGDRDATALRDFLATRPQPALATVAGQLLDLAESRGASLVPRDSSGLLVRATAGTTLELAPSRRWPQWDIAVGTLRARRGTGEPVELASGVQVVRNVIPAAISSDGRYVAYETDGHVHVRDLQSGADQDLGPGIAPRAMPMSAGFLFARPGKSTPERDRDALEYALLYRAWAAGEPVEIGKVVASARQTVNGNASAMRWARIVDGEGSFLLTGDGLDAPVTLPDLAAH